MDFLSFFMPKSADLNDNYQLFGLSHLLWLIIPLLILVGLVFYLRKHQKSGKAVMLTLAAVLLVLRIVKYFILKPFFWNEGWQQIIPFELCTIMAFVFPFTIYYKSPKLNTFIYPLGIIGGIVTIFYSEWIFDGKGLDFNKLESLIVHWILVYIPYVRESLGEFTFDIKKIYRPLVALIILVAYATLANWLITPGANHMFLRTNPLPVQIPGIHHIFTLGLIGIILIGLLYLPFINCKKRKG